VDTDDLLIYALYPVTGKRFLNWKYGKEPVPEDVRPITLEKVRQRQELVKKALAGELVEKPRKEAPEKSAAARTFNVFVDGDYFEVGVDEVGGSPVLNYIQQMPASAPMPAAPKPAPAAPAPQPAAAPKPEAAKSTPAPAADADGTPMTAPMPGMIVSVAKNVGDAVEKGDTVIVLEAMKMENALPAPVGGTIKAINVAQGASVAKGAVLAVIG
jgi:oxaloacetate decarboxylase alpha subunit/pyruvate carboxylase subunit B